MRRRRSERNAVAIGFAVSATIHLLAFTVGPDFVIEQPLASRLRRPVRVESAIVRHTIRVHTISPVLGEPAATDRRVVEHAATEPATLKERLGSSGRVAEPIPPAHAVPRSAADRLTPPSDVAQRVVMPRAGPVGGSSGIDRAGERVALRLAELNDSIVGEQTAARHAVDWTWSGEGKRWGYSPGFIHLGERSVRYTIEHVGAAATAERIRQWQEHRDQAERTEVRAVTSERIRAMRERKAGDRARKNEKAVRSR